MARTPRQTPEFDPGRALICRRPLRYGGRSFAVGAPFPWRQLSVSERAVFRLFRTGMVAHSIPVAGGGQLYAEDVPQEAPAEPSPAPKAKGKGTRKAKASTPEEPTPAATADPVTDDGTDGADEFG